jgi:hypothetical protein
MEQVDFRHDKAFFVTTSTVPGLHKFLFTGYRKSFLRGQSGRRLNHTTHLHLSKVKNFLVCNISPPPSLYAMVLSCWTRVNSTVFSASPLNSCEWFVKQNGNYNVVKKRVQLFKHKHRS